MFVATLVAIPIFLVKIPDEYFAREANTKRPLPMRILRTVLGVALVLLGLAMLVLPGQGLLTVLVGLSVLDLPIKRKAIRKILSNEKVHSAIDKLRKKHGKGSLQVPGDPGKTGNDELVPRHA